MVDRELLGEVGKLLLLSLILSVAIKYGGPYLHLPPTPLTAGLLVGGPLLIALAILAWAERRAGMPN
ncbi:MAG: hypothetical protein IGQ88_01040 [Gloeomargaritaceae cyanobacterium C42_A2020_066]|nr:hypothetical protein [Gloeomargaritaceae cyanobacterium C42_A2020_066]